MRTFGLSLFLLTTHLAASGQAALTAATSDVAALPGFGFKSVAEAIDTLKARPDVQIQVTKPDSWTIINEPDNRQWSFAPNTHSAYPAVVRRDININTQGDVFIEMTALCESLKPNCDKLIEDFKALNEQMRKSIQIRLAPSGTK